MTLKQWLLGHSDWLWLEFITHKRKVCFSQRFVCLVTTISRRGSTNLCTEDISSSRCRHSRSRDREASVLLHHLSPQPCFPCLPVVSSLSYVKQCCVLHTHLPAPTLPYHTGDFLDSWGWFNVIFCSEDGGILSWEGKLFVECIVLKLAKHVLLCLSLSVCFAWEVSVSAAVMLSVC